MAKVVTRFDFSDIIPSPSKGGFNEDGVLGIYGKNTPKEIQNRLDARRWNEYERVMALLADAIGDYDFTETFPGLKIDNVSDAIRRLKTELNAALALISSSGLDEEIDTRLYGIEVGWCNIGLGTLGSIMTEYYTPGSSFRYEPSFELIETNSNSLKVLGGRISLPEKELIVPPALGSDGAYEFDIPEIEFSQNVSFVFGPGLSLPAGPENRVEVTNGRFTLPVNTLALSFSGRSVGTVTYGLGAGVKEFLYSDISGSFSKQVSIVLVSGTVVNDQIDISQPVSYYLGTDTFRSGSLEVIPPSYDVMVDPLSSTGKCSGVTDGIYYAYYMVPDVRLYCLGVNKLTGIMELEDALVTESGAIKAGATTFPLYIIKCEFNPVFSALQNVVEEARVYTYRRVSNPLESSVSHNYTNDAIVDVRRFKSRPKPHLVPAWVPKDYIASDEILRTDIRGNEKKVLPLFVLLPIKHAKQRYVFENISTLSPAEIEESKRLNHLFFTKLDYIYFPAEHRDVCRKKLGRMLTGSDGMYPEILGFFGVVKYNGTNYTNLADIDPALSLELEVKSYDDSIAWKGHTKDLSNIYSWTVESGVRKYVTSLSEISVSVKLSKETTYPVYLEDLQCVLTPKVTKIHTSSAGSLYKEVYDHEIGRERTSHGVRFLSNGKLEVTRKISPLYKEILNNELYNEEEVANTSTVTIDTGLTSRPLWWKVVNSVANQYVLFTDGPQIKIARVSLSDPRVHHIKTLSFPLSPGEVFEIDNPITEIYQCGLNLELTIPERPKVTAVFKGPNHFRLAVASFYEDIDGEPEYQTLTTVSPYSASAWKCIGLFRKYQYDSENSHVSSNIDAVDSYRIFLKSSDSIAVVETPAMMYVNYLGYRSQEPVVTYLVPYDGFFSTNSIVIGYVENFRNSKENPKDGSNLQERYLTFCMWHSPDDNAMTVTVKRDLTNPDPLSGSSVVYLHNFGTEALLTTPRIIRQSTGLEIGGYTLTTTPLRVTYNIYNGAEIRRAENLSYDFAENYSIGTFLTFQESTKSTHVINKSLGELWQEGDLPTVAENYQHVNALVASLLNSEGIPFKINQFNSDVEGMARVIEVKDNLLKVANVRSRPRSAAFVSSYGTARRVGKFNTTTESEVFYMLNVVGDNKLAKKYGVVLFSDYVETSEEVSGWPNQTFPKNPEEVTPPEDSAVLVELGSAAGTNLNAGIWNINERLTRFEEEFLKKSTNGTDLYDIHSTRTALSLYPDSELDVPDKKIALPNNRRFIKYGSPEKSLATPVENQVYLYMDLPFDYATVIKSITTNISQTVLKLGFPMDPGYIHRTKFYKVGFIFQTTNAPSTGVLVVQIQDQYNNVTTVEKTFYRSRTVVQSNNVEVIVVNDIANLDSSKKYTFSFAVKTGQSFTVIDTLKLPSKSTIEFAVRFLASPVDVSYDNSIWKENFQIKLGGEHIWTPCVKQIQQPWKIEVGGLASDKVLPFVTQNRKYGIVSSRNGSEKTIWTHNLTQWDQTVVPGTNGLIPVYYDEKYDGRKILITRSNTHFFVHNYFDNAWHTYTVPGSWSNISKEEVSLSVDENSVHIAFLETGVTDEIHHLLVNPWVSGPPGAITDIVASYAPNTVRNFKIKGMTNDEIALVSCRQNGSNYEFAAYTGFAGGTYSLSGTYTIPVSGNFVPKVNHVSFFGFTPFFVYSWKTATSFYISVKKGADWSPGGSVTWTEDPDSMISGVSGTMDTSTEVFALLTKPKYTVYAANPGDDYLIRGFNDPENPLDPYYIRVKRDAQLTNFTEAKNGEVVWFGHEAGATKTINVWSMHIPVAQRVSTTSNVIGDPYEHNNWMFVDTQYSKIVTDSAFWNQMRIKHAIRYIDLVEDTTLSLDGNVSSYTARILYLLGIIANSRTGFLEELLSLARRVAVGMFNDWNMINLGPDLSKPAQRVYSRGTERMRLNFTYVPSGPAVGKIQSIFYEYSPDSGVNYFPLATENYSYDPSGFLLSTNWT